MEISFRSILIEIPSCIIPSFSNCKDFQASQDISVAFFGLDWTHVFKEIDRIQSTVEEMTKAQNHPTSSLLTLGNWSDSELSEFQFEIVVPTTKKLF